MSAVGRSCVETIKRSRQNVAIATQVLSPSAIGGSLRGQRRLKHFGPPDDDEEEFIFYRRRAAWKKLGYYGLAITVIIFVLMGTILTVGYFQTKSKRGSMSISRSVKLVQDGKPSSYIYSSKTTPDPPSLEPTDAQEFSPTMQSSFLRSYTKQDSLLDSTGGSGQDDNGDIYFTPTAPGRPPSSASGEDQYLADYNLESDSYNNGYDEKEHFKVSNDAFPVDHHDHDEHNDNDNGNGDHNDGADVDRHQTTKEKFSSITDDNKDNLEDAVETMEKESVDDDASRHNNEEWNWKSKDVFVEENKEELPIKEKSLAPQESAISLEIPIYSSNKSSLALEEQDSIQEKNFGQEESLVQNVSSEIKNEEDEGFKDKKQVGEENDDEVSSKEERVDNKNDSSDDDEIGGMEEVEQEVAKDRSKTLDNEHFHKTILHTALFHLDEEKMRKGASSATAILIEDKDIEDSTPNFDDNGHEEYESTSPHQNGTRKHKVKILKNDQVMNMKSTYAPERAKELPPNENDNDNLPSSVQAISEKKDANALIIPDANNSNTSKKKAHRPRNRHFGHASRNKTASDWRLKLRTNKGKKNGNRLGSLAFDNINVLKHPEGAFSSDSGKLFNFRESETRSSSFEEKPRMLSTSSFLPSFESFLKAILSNVQQASGKPSSSSNNRYTNNLFRTTEHPLRSASSDFGTNFVNSIDHLLPTASTTLPSPIVELDHSQFRKRTFNSEHDLVFEIPSPVEAPSLPQPENYFDRLLGQYPAVGAIGSPSATGASLSNFHQSAIFPTISTFPTTSLPYDINPSGSNDAPELVPGMIPLDLASSYVPVGLGSFKNPYTQSSSNQQNPGYNSQNFPFATGNNFANLNPFSFSNNPPQSSGHSALDSIGSLTTASGQPPTYNAISQGIHLLNMISGTVPSTYYHDQVYHSSQSTPSSSYPNDLFSLSSPSFQFTTTPSTTSDFSTLSTNFGQQFDFSGSTASINVSPPPQPSSPQSFSVQPFAFEHHSHEELSNHGPPHNILGHLQANPGGFPLPFIPRPSALKSDREKVEKFLESDNDSDQEPAASSFSQNILATLKKPKGKKKLEQIPTTTAGSIVTLMTKPKIKPTANLFRTPVKPPTTTSQSTFSFQILPQKNLTFNSKSYLSPFANTIIFDGLNEVGLASENESDRDLLSNVDDETSSRSKKKSGATLSTPVWKTLPDPSSAYHPNTGTSYYNPGISPRKMSMSELRSKMATEKKFIKPAPAPATIGLKSGFFT